MIRRLSLNKSSKKVGNWLFWVAYSVDWHKNEYFNLDLSVSICDSLDFNRELPYLSMENKVDHVFFSQKTMLIETYFSVIVWNMSNANLAWTSSAKNIAWWMLTLNTFIFWLRRCFETMCSVKRIRLNRETKLMTNKINPFFDDEGRLSSSSFSSLNK